MRKHILIPSLNVDIDQYLQDAPSDLLVVIHDFYSPTTTFNTVNWSEFSNTYMNYENSNIAVVGLNRMRTSQNRYELVHSYLYTINKYDTKIVIDEKPFSGEPWRAWYPQSFIQRNFLGIMNSFPIEGEYRRWFLKEINYCRLVDIKGFIKNVDSHIPKLNTVFKFVQPTESQLNLYDEIKKFVFDKFDTPKMIISKMLKNCNDNFGLTIGFEDYLKNREIVIPDLKLYQFVIEENKRRLNIYNSFTNG